MSEFSDEYNLERVYDEQIAPLMEKIIEVCKKEGLPMFATFYYQDDSDGRNAATTIVPRGETNGHNHKRMLYLAGFRDE